MDILYIVLLIIVIALYIIKYNECKRLQKEIEIITSQKNKYYKHMKLWERAWKDSKF